MNKERLIAFTDAVLAIIMTILVLELEKPQEATLAAFWGLRQNFFAYFLSFFWLGSLWMALNSLWDKVEKISTSVVWWSLVLLFLASFLPYATGLVSTHFDSRVMQGFYGLVVIMTTVANWFLHKVLDKPNAGNEELLRATAEYRKLLLPDIAIKILGMVLGMIIYPPLVSYSVLLAAAYIIGLRHILLRKEVLK